MVVEDVWWQVMPWAGVACLLQVEDRLSPFHSPCPHAARALQLDASMVIRKCPEASKLLLYLILRWEMVPTGKLPRARILLH